MKAHNEAALATLVAGFVAGRTYAVGDVPGAPVYPYRVVSVNSGPRRNYRRGSVATSRRFRVVVQHFGKSGGEVTTVVDKTAEALCDKRIAVTGRKTTPCREDIATDIDRDPSTAGVLYALLTYNFTSSPA